MFAKMNLEEVKEYIRNSSPETKVYIGVDSERIMINEVWYADYTTAIVVHRDGKHGCRIFGEIERERDYDKRIDRPSLRLMNEVYRVSAIYRDLYDCFEDRHVEVHLDINPDEIHGSSCVIQQAVGYIRGSCNIVPMVKPNAFAASYAADRLKEVLNRKAA
jgi:predicted RNase H-related nuclease YkuK (DUF458 family)